ncbi:unnamed protein product [Amoebophrya sp. A120]|nr:unnamed protein product [Amoebophrya sp. A120]|eukprot:GSA120T00006230001.1
MSDFVKKGFMRTGSVAFLVADFFLFDGCALDYFDTSCAGCGVVRHVEARSFRPLPASDLLGQPAPGRRDHFLRQPLLETATREDQPGGPDLLKEKVDLGKTLLSASLASTALPASTLASTGWTDDADFYDLQGTFRSDALPLLPVRERRPGCGEHTQETSESASYVATCELPGGESSVTAQLHSPRDDQPGCDARGSASKFVSAPRSSCVSSARKTSGAASSFSGGKQQKQKVAVADQQGGLLQEANKEALRHDPTDVEPRSCAEVGLPSGSLPAAAAGLASSSAAAASSSRAPRDVVARARGPSAGERVANLACLAGMTLMGATAWYATAHHLRSPCTRQDDFDRWRSSQASAGHVDGSTLVTAADEEPSLGGTWADFYEGHAALHDGRTREEGALPSEYVERPFFTTQSGRAPELRKNFLGNSSDYTAGSTSTTGTGSSSARSSHDLLFAPGGQDFLYDRQGRLARANVYVLPSAGPVPWKSFGVTGNKKDGVFEDSGRGEQATSVAYEDRDNSWQRTSEAENHSSRRTHNSVVWTVATQHHKIKRDTPPAYRKEEFDRLLVLQHQGRDQNAPRGAIASVEVSTVPAGGQVGPARTYDRTEQPEGLIFGTTWVDSTSAVQPRGGAEQVQREEAADETAQGPYYNYQHNHHVLLPPWSSLRPADAPSTSRGLPFAPSFSENAEDTSATSWAIAAQNFHDNIVLAEAYVGEAKRPLKFIIDTGSSDNWVLQRFPEARWGEQVLRNTFDVKKERSEDFSCVRMQDEKKDRRDEGMKNRDRREQEKRKHQPPFAEIDIRYGTGEIRGENCRERLALKLNTEARRRTDTSASVATSPAASPEIPSNRLQLPDVSEMLMVYSVDSFMFEMAQEVGISGLLGLGLPDLAAIHGANASADDEKTEVLVEKLARKVRESSSSSTLGRARTDSKNTTARLEDAASSASPHDISSTSTIEREQRKHETTPSDTQRFLSPRSRLSNEKEKNKTSDHEPLDDVPAMRFELPCFYTIMQDEVGAGGQTEGQEIVMFPQHRSQVQNSPTGPQRRRYGPEKTPGQTHEGGGEGPSRGRHHESHAGLYSGDQRNRYRQPGARPRHFQGQGTLSVGAFQDIAPRGSVQNPQVLPVLPSWRAREMGAQRKSNASARDERPKRHGHGLDVVLGNESHFAPAQSRGPSVRDETSLLNAPNNVSAAEEVKRPEDSMAFWLVDIEQVWWSNLETARDINHEHSSRRSESGGTQHKEKSGSSGSAKDGDSGRLEDILGFFDSGTTMLVLPYNTYRTFQQACYPHIQLEDKIDYLSWPTHCCYMSEALSPVLHLKFSKENGKQQKVFSLTNKHYCGGEMDALVGRSTGLENGIILGEVFHRAFPVTYLIEPPYRVVL